MAVELAGITKSFLASIHREGSAFYTLIHHTVGVTLLMVDSNWILELHFIFLQRQNFYQARSQFPVAKRISMYS